MRIFARKSLFLLRALAARGTIQSPDKGNTVERRTKMARVISDECISCGACADTCPVGAISEGDGKFVVDANECIDCGACEDGCPVGAISEA